MLLTLAGIGQPNPLNAQESLWIAGTTLRLGMPKAEVISLLQKAEHDLKKIPGAGDGWVIMTKAGPPFDSAGLVSFEQGRLTSVSKDWGNFRGPETVALANALYAVFSPRAGNLAVVKAETKYEPGSKIQFVTIMFGKRTISITIFEAKEVGGKPVVGVTEGINE